MSGADQKFSEFVERLNKKQKIIRLGLLDHAITACVKTQLILATICSRNTLVHYLTNAV